MSSVCASLRVTTGTRASPCVPVRGFTWGHWNQPFSVFHPHPRGLLTPGYVQVSLLGPVTYQWPFTRTPLSVCVRGVLCVREGRSLCLCVISSDTVSSAPVNLWCMCNEMCACKLMTVFSPWDRCRSHVWVSVNRNIWGHWYLAARGEILGPAKD